MMRVRRAGSTPGPWCDVQAAAPGLPPLTAPTPPVQDTHFFTEPLPLPPRWSAPESPGYNKLVLPHWGASRWGFGHVLVTEAQYVILMGTGSGKLIDVELDDGGGLNGGPVVLRMFLNRALHVADWRDPTGAPVAAGQESLLLCLELFDLRYLYSSAVLRGTDTARYGDWDEVRDAINAVLPTSGQLTGDWVSEGAVPEELTPANLSHRSAACLADALTTQATIRLRYDFATGGLEGVSRDDSATAAWWGLALPHLGGLSYRPIFSDSVQHFPWGDTGGSPAAIPSDFQRPIAYVVPGTGTGRAIEDYAWPEYTTALVGYAAQPSHGHADCVVYDHDSGVTRFYAAPGVYPLPLVGRAEVVGGATTDRDQILSLCHTTDAEGRLTGTHVTWLKPDGTTTCYQVPLCADCSPASPPPPPPPVPPAGEPPAGPCGNDPVSVAVIVTNPAGNRLSGRAISCSAAGNSPQTTDSNGEVLLTGIPAVSGLIQVVLAILEPEYVLYQVGWPGEPASVQEGNIVNLNPGTGCNFLIRFTLYPDNPIPDPEPAP